MSMIFFLYVGYKYNGYLQLANCGTLHQWTGTADKNSWLNARNAAGIVAGMHNR